MNVCDAILSVTPNSSRDAMKAQSMGGYVWKYTGLGTGTAGGTYRALVPSDTDIGEGAGVQHGDGADACHISFVQRDGDQFVFTYKCAVPSTSSTPASGYTYTYEGKIAGNDGALGTGTPVSTAKLEISAELFALLFADASWSAGRQTEFETGRTGTGEW